ncbi:uncharacterized protein PGTG_15444 [Puccinia graminis f. sp. tritici CRL 75-36-700-3]|uniref:Uncharacterized protein n=1 Tax=Puccinia graminis f. sp. tritici (strain CRL 75-36-700-3 / race SCCL) TaxID=418459 RepID=E3KZR3_PUCGT|nr:uncharacterized protein PGTG_15444 [Puccinia graminis f. sp. tritici CRL 75-36-700-3]EFP89788.1 hypothetical protein PGTG_15444 [Puccinia graminis f. sp. tritici CRL 75-36-700-3]
MISSRFIQLVAIVFCAYACLDIQAQAVTGPSKPSQPSSNAPPHLGMTGDNKTNNPNGLHTAPRQSQAPSVPSSGAKQPAQNPSKTMNHSQTKTAEMAKPTTGLEDAKPVGPGPVGTEKAESGEEKIPAGAEGLTKRGGLRDVLWKRGDLPSIQGIGKKPTSLKEHNPTKKPDEGPGTNTGGGKTATGQSTMARESSGYVAGSSAPDAGKNKSGRNKLMLNGGSGSSEPSDTSPSSEGNAEKNKQGGVHASLNERDGESIQHLLRKRQDAGFYKTKFKAPKLGGGTTSGVAVGTFGGPPVPINGVMGPTGPIPLPTAIVPVTPVGGNGMGGMPPMLGGGYF